MLGNGRALAGGGGLPAGLLVREPGCREKLIDRVSWWQQQGLPGPRRIQFGRTWALLVSLNGGACAVRVHVNSGAAGSSVHTGPGRHVHGRAPS